MTTRIKINDNDVELDYAIAQRDIIQSQLKEFTSIMDGTRHYINKDNHIYFSVLLELWKYFPTQSARRTKFLEFYNYKYETCNLQPDLWWGWLTDANGDLLDVQITEVSSYPFTDANSEFDICVMRFKSINTITYDFPLWRIQDEGQPLDGTPIDFTDEDGNTFNIRWNPD